MKAHPLGLFISYAHKDDQFRQELEAHLKPLQRQGLVEVWSDRAIEAGQEWEKNIGRQLETAEIILLLISSDFLASEYIYDKELKRAMERHDAGEARVIPVFLRPCNWKGEVFGKLQGVPNEAKPISQWSDRDEAFTLIVQAIGKAVEAVRNPTKEKLSVPLQADKEVSYVISNGINGLSQVLKEAEDAGGVNSAGKLLGQVRAYIIDNLNRLGLKQEADSFSSISASAYFLQKQPRIIDQASRCRENLHALRKQLLGLTSHP